MGEQARDTLTIAVSEIGEHLSRLPDRVSRHGQRIILEQDGKPVAAVIAAPDLELLQRFEAARAGRWLMLEEIWRRNADKDPDEVERDVAAEISVMRAEDRTRAATSPR